MTYIKNCDIKELKPGTIFKYIKGSENFPKKGILIKLNTNDYPSNETGLVEAIFILYGNKNNGRPWFGRAICDWEILKEPDE